MKRAFRLFSAVSLGLAGGIVALSQPAQAMTYHQLTPTSWAYTDGGHPTTSYLDPTGDAPVGHTNHSYFTFDLSSLKGVVPLAATFHEQETAVADCSKAAPVELWRTKAISATTTWKKSPAEVARLDQHTFDGAQDPCPGSTWAVDLLPTITSALARHDPTLTLELRIAQAQESDASLDRSFAAQPDIELEVTHAPVLSNLKLDGQTARGCGTATRHPGANGQTTFTGTATDPDAGEWAQLFFAVWPIDHPDQRTRFGGNISFGTPVSTSYDLSTFADGTQLGWAAQAVDPNGVTSPWSKTCYLTIDKVAPTTGPVVTSALYDTNEQPGSGGVGVQGTFRFDAQGDADVVGFTYFTNDLGGGFVAANHPGGRASLAIKPNFAGQHLLEVHSVDQAGNVGPANVYRYIVRDTQPFASLNVAGIGIPSQITFTSPATNVTSFGYQVDGGTEVTVPVKNGTATADITFTVAETATITTKAYAGKKVIGTNSQQFQVEDSPGVASDQFNLSTDALVGQAGTFTFTPRTTGVVAYQYDFGTGPQRVDAAANGTATLDWTATVGGYVTVRVSSVKADGSLSATAYYQFFVIDPRPSVYFYEVHNYPETDGVGLPLTVQVLTQQPGVTNFVYSWAGGPQQTVPADSMLPLITVTPTHAGVNTFSVRSELADGTLEPATDTSVTITDAPAVTAPPSIQGTPLTLTLKPALSGVTSYRWHVGYASDPGTVTAVAAGPDGTATISYTPTTTFNVISVVSVSGDGALSTTRQFQFTALDPKVYVYSSRYGSYPSGGIGTPGDFVFTSQLAVAEFDYRVDNGPTKSVAPDASGSGRITIVPDHNGPVTIHVSSLQTDGTTSPVTDYTFVVGTAPHVDSIEYPQNMFAGGVGVPGLFTLNGGEPGVTSFVYEVDGGAETTVAAVNGTGQFTYTPTDPGPHDLFVHGVTADGTTDQAYYPFYVSS